MRALVVGICATLCAMPAAAQQAGPIAFGMSPSELNAISPDAVFTRYDTPPGTTRARGTIRAFDVTFNVEATFYWNTGLRNVTLRHGGEENEQTCAALVEASRLEVERTLGATPQFNREANRWNGYWAAQRDDVSMQWSGSWVRAPIGSQHCGVSIELYGQPPPAPDPMLVELALAEPLAGPPVWLTEPTHEQVRALHPQRAAEREVGGVASIACRVRDTNGVLECLPRTENPPGYGFGAAAVRASELYRIAPEVGGAPALGRKFVLVVDFTDVPQVETNYQE